MIPSWKKTLSRRNYIIYVRNVTNREVRRSPQGGYYKKLSILGDSISTYEGVSNDPSAKTALLANPCFYRPPFPLEKTYWMRVIDALGLSLCVNNSWSGGNLSGAQDFSGVSRAAQLARDDGVTPDIILVFMGINDLGRGVDISLFENDYEKTLKIIRQKHPNAQVFCVNLPDRDVRIKQRTEAFNRAISAAAERMGRQFYVVDLFHSPLNNDNYYNNTVDGLHPDEDGMRLIADTVESAMRSCDG